MNIKLYTREYCGMCIDTKNYLKARGIAFEEENIDENNNRQNILEKYPSLTHLPVIFVDDQIIGGQKELYEMFEKERMEN